MFQDLSYIIGTDFSVIIVKNELLNLVNLPDREVLFKLLHDGFLYDLKFVIFGVLFLLQLEEVVFILG